MNSNKSLDNWDTLYASGIRGKYPNEMLIRFINSKFPYEKRKDCKILDLGYGTGRHLIYLAEEGFQTYGIEYSSLGEKIAKKWLADKGFTANLKIGSAIDNFFELVKFDAVVDIACIQHNTFADMEKIVANVYDSLKKGGYLFSLLKNREDSLFKTGTKFKGITYEFPAGIEKVTNPTIISFPTHNDLLRLFRNFSDVHIEKEAWTYDNMNKKVSHWIITCQK
jgi:SAM-dependent methyltransferase